MTPKPGFRLALFTCALALIVILLGAWTRLVDAGLGCPDWPGCYGQLVVPQSEDGLARAQAAFPDIPIDSFKAQVEMTHRYVAMLLGLLVLALGMIAWRLRQHQNYPVLLALALVILVLCQGAAGAFTVIWRLWPQVVTAHLLGGFITAGLLVLLTWRLSGVTAEPPVMPHRLRPARILTILGLLLLLMQIALGGWTSSNYAALACPDLPQCQGQWWPETDFAKGFNFSMQVGSNYLGGQLQSDARTAIHLAHRLGAVILTLYLSILMLILFRWGLRLAWVVAVLVILGIQFSFGMANILLALPIGVATAHNGVAAILLIALLVLSDRMLYAHAARPTP